MSSYLRAGAAFLLFILFLSGCGYREGVLVKEPVSYLWFTGNIDNAFARIDGNEPFEVSKSSRNEGNTSNLLYYRIAPGKHRVIVERNRTVVVDRILYIGDEQIQEIQVP